MSRRRALLIAAGLPWLFIGLFLLARGAPPSGTTSAAVPSVDAHRPVHVSAQALRARLVGSTAPLVIDVRTTTAFADGHIPGALSMPLLDLRQHVRAFSTAREIVLYCGGAEVQSLEGANILREMGYTHVLVLAGGFPAWQTEVGQAGPDEGCGCGASAEAYKLWILHRQGLTR